MNFHQQLHIKHRLSQSIIEKYFTNNENNQNHASLSTLKDNENSIEIAETIVSPEDRNIAQTLQYVKPHASERLEKILRQNVKECQVCKTQLVKLQQCAGCRIVRYCSKHCQKKDWKCEDWDIHPQKSHKRQCSRYFE